MPSEPISGENGGQVVVAGTPAAVMSNPGSTSQYQPAEREGFSDNLPKREVFCGFSDPFLGRVYPTRVSQAGRNASRQNARPRLIGRSGARLAARPPGPVATSQDRTLGCRPRTHSRLWVDC